MNAKLFFQAIAKVLCGAALIAVLLFVPAGTLNYPQGWLFMGLLFVPMLAAGFVLMFKNPELLRKRLNAKEEQAQQKLVLALSGAMFLAAFIVAGLNFRFAWFVLPMWVSYAAATVFLLAYLMYAEVLRENEYLSRTVEVQADQQVIDTGLYGTVRHPMYTSTVLLFLAMPLILGCLFSFAIMLIYIPIIVLRIKNEEKVLAEGLKGYKEYMKKVKYRLIPFIW